MRKDRRSTHSFNIVTLKIVSINPDRVVKSTQPQESPKKQPSSPKKQVTKSKSLLPDSYLEILGGEAPLNVQNEKTIETNEVTKLVADKQKTLVRAMKAANDGDTEEASYLFRLHATMIVPQKVTATDERRVPIVPIADRCVTWVNLTADEDKIDEDEKPFIENGITFMPGTPCHAIDNIFVNTIENLEQ